MHDDIHIEVSVTVTSKRKNRHIKESVKGKSKSPLEDLSRATSPREGVGKEENRSTQPCDVHIRIR